MYCKISVNVNDFSKTNKSETIEDAHIVHLDYIKYEKKIFL